MRTILVVQNFCLVLIMVNYCLLLRPLTVSSLSKCRQSVKSDALFSLVLHSHPRKNCIHMYSFTSIGCATRLRSYHWRGAQEERQNQSKNSKEKTRVHVPGPHERIHAHCRFRKRTMSWRDVRWVKKAKQRPEPREWTANVLVFFAVSHSETLPCFLCTKEQHRGKCTWHWTIMRGEVVPKSSFSDCRIVGNFKH